MHNAILETRILPIFRHFSSVVVSYYYVSEIANLDGERSTLPMCDNFEFPLQISFFVDVTLRIVEASSNSTTCYRGKVS